MLGLPPQRTHKPTEQQHERRRLRHGGRRARLAEVGAKNVEIEQVDHVVPVEVSLFE